VLMWPPFFNAMALGWHLNWRKFIYFTWWDNIACPIGQIMLFKFCQICPRWLSWKICCRHYINIFSTSLSDIWNLLNLLRLWK
jgi:hypothetical protein